MALLLGIFGAAVIYAGLGAMPTPDVEQEFYIACAQVLPVLLLAHIVRLSSVRNGLFAARARGNEIRQKVEAMAEDMESTANDEDPKGSLKQQVEELRQELASMTDSLERTDSRAEDALELIAGAFIVTLTVEAVGIAAVLTALAVGSDSTVVFVITVLAVGWILVSLVVFEYLHFTSPEFMVVDTG